MELREGIILKTNKYQENSKIAYIITKEGLVTALIRSSLEYKSKNFAYSQELTKIMFDISISKKKSFDILTTGKSINSYLNIKKDYNNLLCVTKIMDLTYKSINHVTNYNNLYQLFDYTLNNINEYDEYHFYPLIFKLKLLYLLGIGPNFHECSECGSKNVVSFSVEKGGMVCKKCSDYKAYNNEYIQIMKILYLAKLDKLTNELIKELPIESFQIIEEIVNHYYENYLSIKV